MHPTISYHLATAQIADDHARAERNRAVRAAIRAMRARQPRPSHPVPWWRAAALARYGRLARRRTT